MKTMKTIIRKITAVLAASLAFISCAKQEAKDNSSIGSVGGARTIAVSFANKTTKTTLEGRQPKFVANDVIKVSNGSAAEYCFVSIDGSGNASITTELTGALTMVYPATAAKMNGNAIEGVLVPTVQDGTFASANICKAEIAADATSATFANKTAVFRIYPCAGTSPNYLEVITSDLEIANSVPADSEYDTMCRIHVASASASAVPVYVSILVPSGLKISDLTFSDGYNMKNLMDDDEAVAVNSLYTINDANWSRPYVEIGGIKWATCNVGAGSPTDYGWYFFWAGTTGYVREGTRKWVTAQGGSELSGGFNYENTPYQTQKTDQWTQTKFTKYLGSTTSELKDPSATDPDALKRVLDPEDDAARANWGDPWRLPTTDEFLALFTACGASTRYAPPALSSANPGKGVYVVSAEQTYISEYTGVSGILFCDGISRLFLPAAGSGYNTGIANPERCYYMSRNLNAGSPQDMYHFQFSPYPTLAIKTESSARFVGLSVRPVFDL